MRLGITSGSNGSIARNRIAARKSTGRRSTRLAAMLLAPFEYPTAASFAGSNPHFLAAR